MLLEELKTPGELRVDLDYNTNYWMAIQDPNDASKTLGIMGI